MPHDDPQTRDLDDILQTAVDLRATDIHLDDSEDGWRVCYRIDGTIHERVPLTSDAGDAALNQLIVLNRLTPGAVTQPEESWFQWGDQSSYSFRSTFTPTASGTSVHLRSLKSPQDILKPEELGMPKDVLEKVRTRVGSPEGLILISGPTAAGKTMTMYSLLQLLELEHLICTSVEDPVEYELPRIRQLNVAEHLSMADGIRTLLRMDPDIMLIGEIRDGDSARAAVQAGTSGRLALSTLHARDVVTAVQGMHQFGVPYPLLSSTLRLVINQNLVRTLCENCRREITPDPSVQERFEKEMGSTPDKIYEAVGCDACGDIGYKGQTAVFQTLFVDEPIREIMMDGRIPGGLHAHLEQQQIPTVYQQGFHAVAEGRTTLSEVETLQPVTS